MIQYPQVDLVMKGDSTEEPMLHLIRALKNNNDFSTIPNLTWMDKTGKIQSNPISYLPKDLNNFTNNYKNLFKLA
ncbi:MAG: TIGR04190 family B12-binding domain/radical SAM domain protein, partial [bacterium]|nr:TIGR04190 family B12-binding domain/radical SAM domain protein [bacterium]